MNECESAAGEYDENAEKQEEMHLQRLRSAARCRSGRRIKCVFEFHDPTVYRKYAAVKRARSTRR